MKKITLPILFFLLTACSVLYAQKGPEKTARKPVDWLQYGIIYQINTRAFTPEGTLKAAEKRLPHIAGLGATVVYICPVFCADDDMNKKYWSARQKGSGMENPKNPYRIKDYFHVDPEYGTDEDLKSFVKSAHDLELKVMFDLVYFHCGPTAVFLKDHPEFVQRDKNGDFITGSWAFPRLNFNSPELREYLYSNMEYFLKEFDVDGYRMDVGDLVPLDFWVEGRKRMEKIKPNIGTLCEGMRGDDLLYAFDECYGFLLQFQYPKVFDKGQPVSLMREAKEKMAKKPKGAQYMHCVENHDYANQTASIAKGKLRPRSEERWGEKQMDAILAFLFTLDGTPMIYCGQEIGDKRPHSIFGKKNEFHIHWKEDANTDSAKRRTDLVKRLAKIRKENKQFTEGDLVWLDNSHPEDVLSYERILGNTKSMILINFRGKDLKTTITEKDGSKKTFDLAPYAWKIVPPIE
ncbi:MAG: alpha-amylase family glycosyl hydrolase [Planctomycetia bacterium]|nr:alpha-amylase family glycosyl hydrolase [Planctomycetia bacterium]